MKYLLFILYLSSLYCNTLDKPYYDFSSLNEIKNSKIYNKWVAMYPEKEPKIEESNLTRKILDSIYKTADIIGVFQVTHFKIYPSDTMESGLNVKFKAKVKFLIKGIYKDKNIEFDGDFDNVPHPRSYEQIYILHKDKFGGYSSDEFIQYNVEKKILEVFDNCKHEKLQTSKIIPSKEYSFIDLNSSVDSSDIIYNSDNHSITINKKIYKSTLLFFPVIYVDYKIDKDKLIFINNFTASKNKRTVYYFFHRQTLLLEKIEEMTCDNYNQFCTISINYFNKPFHLSQMEDEDTSYTFLEKSNVCNVVFDSFYPNIESKDKITFRRINYTINNKKYSFLYDKKHASLNAYLTKSGTLYGVSCSDTSKYAQIIECKVNNHDIDCNKVLDANISE